MRIQKGSGIICALMATGGLLALMSLVIRYTTYGVDIAYERVLCEQRYFALKGLLNYGVMLAENTTITEHAIINDETIDINPWLDEYTGKIIILNEHNTINVQARLYITSKEFIDMQYSIPKKENP